MDTPSSASQTDGSSKMNIIYLGNEFPGDDLKLLLRRLRSHSKDRKHPLVAQFLDEATLALKDEIRNAPTEVRSQFPTFESILEIDDPKLRKGALSGSVDGVLLCVFELAAFIGYLETTSNVPDALSLTTGTSYLSGLGIGLLATAAIAVASTPADIIRAGAQVIRVAFRLGVVVSDASRNIDPLSFIEGNPADSWAYVIHGVSSEDAQRELDAIHARDETPASSKIFISAPAANSVTISGPPSRLKALLKTSGIFRDRRSITLPVYSGLCHADHIYSQRHVEKVLDVDVFEELGKQRIVTSVLSSFTGIPYAATNGRELFHDIVDEILRHQIKYDFVVQSLASFAEHARSCTLYSFRSSLSTHDVINTIKRDVPDVETSAIDMLPWLLEDSPEAQGPRGTAQSKIAIVGMSCRMPGGATDTEKFWQILEQGLDVHRKIPADRFDVESHHDPTGKRINTSHTQYGCFIDEPGLFDAPFFHMSPKEASQTDPMQRLALVTAYEALERAGYVANRTAATNLHRIGTWYGQASDDYREVNTAQEISTYFIPGGCRAFGPGRINYFFKFAGPSFNCDTACSSSLASIQAACTALWAGEVDTVVAGGLNVLTNSDAFAGLSHGHFLTKTPNACKTWDSEADGYCRADGVGSVVMKRLEDALEDNDNILGVVLAAATNHSANAVSITHPHAGHQEDLGKLITGRAGIDPLDVSYVEMHGTGTQAGDMEEIQSVSNLYAPAAPRRRTAKQPLHIGAVKSNVGHGEAAAGVTALLKVLLMLQKSTIPRHVGIKHALNPAFPQDLDKRGLRIPYEQQPWIAAEGKKRIAAINNFSAAGGNTTLLIEEGPVRTLVGQDPRPTHVVAVSAKSKASLKGNLTRYLAYLDSNKDVSLADLAYSTTARRYHHNHRFAIPAADLNYLRKGLVAALEKVDNHKPIPATGAPSVAFVFTGQGASYKSMSLELFHESTFFRDQILDLDSVAQAQGFPSIIPAIDGSHDKDYQHSAVITQLALVCVEIALARYWISIGVKPNCVMGHSLGEYAAMHIADVLTAADALYLVGTRARMLEEKCTGGSHKMLAVRASLGDIENAANGLPFEVACLNGPQETVLSGTIAAMDAISAPLQAAGFRCTSLDVAFAFHSSQTDPILEDFEIAARKSVLFQAPNLPVISPLLDKVIFGDKSINASYVRRATREPVNFLAALQKAKKMSVIDESTAFIEIGPHPVAINFVKSGLQSVNVAVPSMRRGENNWTTLAASSAALHCAGVEIAWNEVYRPFEKALRLLDIPTYAWNDKTYWIQYNGDWALTKGNTFYDEEKKALQAPSVPKPLAHLSSTVQNIIAERYDATSGEVTMQSDLMQADFLAAAHGHSMNGCGVVTSSIHADIAYTLGDYLYKKITSSKKEVTMGVMNLVVTKGLVAQSNLKVPQLVEVTISTVNIASGQAALEWRNRSNDGHLDEPFATATLIYGESKQWLDSWSPLSHLIQGRIEALDQLAIQGSANKFSRKMAYTLFANNLVDYADKYRGMQAVVMKDFEAYADVTLTAQKGGQWTVPPYFIDSVAHLAGFIMNCSDASDVKNTFCVTPGWDSMQFARPLTAGSRYQSYVKMIATADDPTVYLGDVYILENGSIVGKVGGIQFRRYPRILLSRFFSPPDSAAAKSFAAAHSTAPSKPVAVTTAPVKAIVVGQKAVATPIPVAATAAASASTAAPAPVATSVASPAPATVAPASDSTAAKAILLIAAETGLDVSDLNDDAGFADLGVDSLMSLVVAEKFRTELGVSINGSLFLEYPTIGDMRKWLEEYYS